MDKFKDYELFIKEKKKFINNFHAISSPLCMLFEDVIKVCNHILEMYQNKEKIDEEHDFIFSEGFSYLSYLFTVLESILEDFFENNPISMSKYSSLIIYYLYINDLQGFLESEESLTKKIKNEIEEIENRIFDILKNKLDFDAQIIEDFDSQLSSVIIENNDFQLIYLIFTDIAESMGLY